MFNQLSTIAPSVKLDLCVEAATSDQWAALTELVSWCVTEGDRSTLLDAIMHFTEAASQAAFRSGWQAHVDPASFIFDHELRAATEAQAKPHCH